MGNMKSAGMWFVLVLLATGGCDLSQRPRSSVANADSAETDARRMIRAGQRRLAPVYAPLAEYIVRQYALEHKEGVGIDVGSGPGTLIIELCKRTDLHWINADINPHFFAYFYRQAEKNRLSHRVSAVAADVHSLPFRDNYADVIVSRGSFPFWKDKLRGFREIYRVLKPGALAYVGRGFSENLPVETARKIRAAQGDRMKYDVEKTALELADIMNELGIRDYRIHRPNPATGPLPNYGIWIEFRKAQAR